MKRLIAIATVLGVGFFAGAVWNHEGLTVQASGDHDGGRASCVSGTWLLRLPDGRIAHETIIAETNGNVLHFHGDAQLSNPDPTLGGMFPDAGSNHTGFRGSGQRVGRNTWEARVIFNAVNIVDGEETGIAYIGIDDAVGTFPDCDTQEFVLTESYFLPEQDADGDGLPDPGEEPFLSIEGLPVRGVRF